MPNQTALQRPSALLAFLLLLLLLPGAGLRAQKPTTGTIVGHIRLSGGKLPSERIQVDLQMRGATIYTTYADGQGSFMFGGLVYNAYYVVINVENYFPVNQRVIVRPDLLPTTYVGVVLTPRETKPAPPPPEAASGGNPHLVDVADYAKRFPPKAVKEFEAGVKADQKGEANQAMKHYQKSIELAPGFYPSHNNLGTIYVAQGNFEAAEGEFAQVIELNHNDAQAYFNLGNVFYLTQRYRDAERTLQEGLKREPGSAFGNYLLGAVHARLGKLDQAEHNLRAALELDPEMSSIRLELANLYLQQGRTAEAIAELKIFAKESPTHSMRPKVEELLEKLESSHPTDL